MVKMNDTKPKNYVLLGPPGSGKSTQATLLKNKYSLAHIDIGSELFRFFPGNNIF
ncbi:MAG: nucleoside monophosphate kinase, partial [Patescibacteria group bacterium]